MSRQKSKLCLGCQRIFIARRDAKTCSAKCRKRYQRGRSSFLQERPMALERSAVSYKYAHRDVGGKRYAR